MVRQHAAEASHPVVGPLVIVGLPRTATTALHYLLAVDPRFRYPRTWELRDPVPPPDLATEADDPRRPSQPHNVGVQHIATVDGPAEDGAIHNLAFRSAETVLPVPSYTAWWRGASYQPVLEYHERILRLLHAHRPPRHWLLKYPNYLFQLPDLVAQYGDAKFVVTHRDPTAAIASTCSVVAESRLQRVPSWKQDDSFGREMLEHYRAAMQRAMTDRDALGEERFFDVGQHEIEQDPLGVAARIYEFAGISNDSELRAAMTEWSAGNQRGPRGAHRYSAEEFGLTPAEIEAAFADYLAVYGEYCRPSG